jgi:6-phosphogluconolactonase
MKTLRAALLLLPLLFNPPRSVAADLFVYFGSHSSGPGCGLSLAHFDDATGVLTKPVLVAEDKEPAFFVIDRAGRRLYTCNSGAPGGLTAYAIEPHTGALTRLNRMPAGGGDTSFVSLDQAGQFALIANYDGGNVAVFRLNADGSLGDRTAFDQHTGRSADPLRQTHAYAHAIITDPANRFALVPDLGVDRLYVYRFDAATGTLAPNDPAFVAVPPGSGPRHVRFHPNGRWVYLVNEMGSSIVAYDWDAVAGRLAAKQTVSALPAGFKGTSACAELEVRPDGRFLYVTNRGDDSIAVFAIDPADGRLALVQHVPSGGHTPRNFAFDPGARWLLCTNHGSNNAVVFRVDEASGRLTPVGDPVAVPGPFCERFLPVR